MIKCMMLFVCRLAAGLGVWDEDHKLASESQSYDVRIDRQSLSCEERRAATPEL